MKKTILLSVLAVMAAMVGCGGDSGGGDNNNGGGTAGTVGGGAGITGVAGTTGAAGIGTGTAGTVGTAGTGTAGTGTDGGVDAAVFGNAGAPAVDMTTFQTMFPAVTNWDALELVYPTSYSGYDGVHTFKVPMRVKCNTTLPLTAWHAIPATAVTIDADPDQVGGVMITIVEPVTDITIGAIDGANGGLAPIKVTIGTDAQWKLGEQRYNNGSDWTLDVLNPMAPPPDTKCTVCHSANSSSGFDVAHTPTQCARISDEAMAQIMTTGTKPADVEFRVIPETIMFGTTTLTNVELYQMFHLWNTTEDSLRGMILYLRSLTPAGQGCVTNPITGTCEDVQADPNAGCP